MSATQNFLTTITGTFNQMTINIASGQIYQIRALIPYILDLSTAGLTLGLVFPAARRAYFNCAFVAAAASPGAPALTAITGDLATRDLAAVTSGTAGIARFFHVDGTLFCSGSGQFLFYARAETANQTSKIADGGSIVCWNMGAQAI